jgi:hypothetical protein
MRHHSPPSVLTLALLPLLLSVLAACGDDGGKRTASACEATSECGDGVCFDATCYSTCTAQNDCQTEELCVRRTEASGDAVDLCVAASDFAGCTDDAACAELVTGPCAAAVCDLDSGLCAIELFEDGVACELAGGVAGVCATGLCVEEATCEPDCEGKTCGDDGCDGSCGGCEEGWGCEEGACVEECDPTCMEGFVCIDQLCHEVGPDPPCAPGYIAVKGECVEECLHLCGEGYTCDEDGECICTPDCEGKVCGGDGCEGSCGQCEEGLTCIDGACICVPDCNGKECGDDGCGGICGECLGCEGEVLDPGDCYEGQCPDFCCPDCADKACGDDGCGGICGACSDGQICVDSQCATACEDACALPGSRQCAAAGQGYQVCDDHDDDGCLDWGEPVPCVEPDVCSEGQCVATCTDECVQDATRCAGNGVQTCGEHDGDACVEWGAPVPCDGSDTCVSGACLCQPDCSSQPTGGDDGCGGTCPGAWEPPAGPGPDCPDLPPVLCDGLDGACDELIQFDPLQDEGYFDALYGGAPPDDARNWASRHVVHAVQYAAAFVACKAAGWEAGNGGPLGLGDMSMEDGSAPSGHPASTFEGGVDMNTAYYQDGTEDNGFRDICDREGQQHCVAPPHLLDAWRTALFIGALHDATDLRVIGVDGQVGLVVDEKLAWLCANGWLDNGACEADKLAYEVEDTGAGWFLFHYHRMHVSFFTHSGGLDP